eukprot:7866444-Pyramimonas_sp.AAC.1
MDEGDADDSSESPEAIKRAVTEAIKAIKVPGERQKRGCTDVVAGWHVAGGSREMPASWPSRLGRPGDAQK